MKIISRILEFRKQQVLPRVPCLSPRNCFVKIGFISFCIIPFRFVSVNFFSHRFRFVSVNFVSFRWISFGLVWFSFISVYFVSRFVLTSVIVQLILCRKTKWKRLLRGRITSYIYMVMFWQSGSYFRTIFFITWKTTHHELSFFTLKWYFLYFFHLIFVLSFPKKLFR
jgi:hypothetical protein